MAPSAAVLQVFVFKDGEFIGTDLFTQREVVIGRDATADLLLESGSVSRRHAIFEQDGKRVFIRDDASTNGVFVNGDKIERCEVGRLDQVFIGEYALKVKLVAQSGATEFESDEETGVIANKVIAQATAPKLDDDIADLPYKKSPAKKSGKKHSKSYPEHPQAAEIAAARAVEKAVFDDFDDEPQIKHHEEQKVKQKVARKKDDERPGRSISAHSIVSRLRAVARSKSHVDAIERAPFFDMAVSSNKSAVAAAKLREQPIADARPEREALIEPTALPSRRPPPIIGANDDDDDDEPYVPTFSMLQQTLNAGSTIEEPTHVEVLVTRNNAISQAVALRRGESFYYYKTNAKGASRRGLRRHRLVRYTRKGECRLEFDESSRATLKRRGERLDIDFISKVARHGRRQATIRAGESVEIEDSNYSYYIRLLRPPMLPPDRRTLAQRLKPDRLITRSMGGSFGTHIALLLVGMLLPSSHAAPAVETESFAEVKLDQEIKLEEPPPPEPEPEPVEETPTAPQPRKVPRRMQAAPNKRARAGGTAKAPPGVLGLLSKRGSSAAPGPAAALAAVTNLSAANAPSGARGFRVSNLASKSATADILVGGGGGGGVVTKGGASLLRGGGGGAGRLSGKGTRRVGGLVEKMPRAMRSRGQGSLDRDAIQKVINQNVGQIQRCYERELLSKPGLSGKVEIEWTITTSGSVRGTRQKYSSLNSVPAVNCIIGRISTWRFPQPKGGEVIVSYPFVFKSISF
ncbi:MAG: FHA domain-containing protein [Deltaproteobacteria bacterium]|nr:FHA domain-containing protein [Deltaproteobacteria bacterium]